MDVLEVGHKERQIYIQMQFEQRSNHLLVKVLTVMQLKKNCCNLLNMLPATKDFISIFSRLELLNASLDYDSCSSSGVTTVSFTSQSFFIISSFCLVDAA